MGRRKNRKPDRTSARRRLPARLPEVLIFGLAGALAIGWFGAGAVIFVLPLALVGLFLIFDRRHPRRPQHDRAGDDLRLREAIDETFRATAQTGERFACLLARIDAPALDVRRSDSESDAAASGRCIEAVSRVIRHEDVLFDLPQRRLAILLSPNVALDRAAILSIAERVQHAIGDIPTQTGAPPVTAALGICRDAALTGGTGEAMLKGAEDALSRAVREGASAIRFHGIDALT